MVNVFFGGEFSGVKGVKGVKTLLSIAAGILAAGRVAVSAS